MLEEFFVPDDAENIPTFLKIIVEQLFFLPFLRRLHLPSVVVWGGKHSLISGATIRWKNLLQEAGGQRKYPVFDMSSSVTQWADYEG